jgi:hypothetical protein
VEGSKHSIFVPLCPIFRALIRIVTTTLFGLFEASKQMQPYVLNGFWLPGHWLERRVSCVQACWRGRGAKFAPLARNLLVMWHVNGIVSRLTRESGCRS